MGDGKPLFDLAHLNLHAGLGGVPTVANLGTIVTAMKLQQDSFGHIVTVKPRYFIAPVSLEVAAEQFFNTQLNGAGVIGTGAEPLINNPYLPVQGAVVPRSGFWLRRLKTDDVYKAEPPEAESPETYGSIQEAVNSVTTDVAPAAESEPEAQTGKARKVK